MGGQTSHLRKIFNYFDHQNKQYITLDDVLQIYKNSGHCKYQKYFNIIFYNFFSGGTKKDVTLDFITFLQYFLDDKQSAIIPGESKSLNTSHSTILNELTQISQSYSELSQQKIMHSDAKSRDISSIAMMLDNMRKKQTQLSDVFSFNELLGLHTRDSSELVIRSEYLNDDNLYMRQYITEQDLALLLDFLADKQISIQHLLGHKSVRTHRNVLEKIDFQNDDQKYQFAKILLKEYDITNTGKLSDIEYSKLIEVIQYELQTHMAFMGLHTTKIQNYMIGKTIGFGRTAICKCGIKIKDSENKLYCLKIMKQQQLKLQEQIEHRESFQQQDQVYCKQISEKQIMETITKTFGQQQINILTMCDYFTYTDKLGEEWDVLVTEMCSGGNLAEYNKTTITTEQIARYLFYQIVLGVQQAHAVGIAHLDLRLENVLLNDRGDIRLCDFGNALVFDIEQPYQGKFPVNLRAGTIAGTLANMPPEMLESTEDFSAEAVDIYCLGLILYELLTKKKAFHSHDDQQLISAIVNSDYVPLNCGFTTEAASLVQALLMPDFRQRPTINEILESPFLQLEMHKPAIARGVILLDPAPKLSELQKALESCFKQQGFTYQEIDMSNTLNSKCLLTWDLTSIHLNLRLTCEEVKDIGTAEDDLLLAAKAVQTEIGCRQLENAVLSSFKRGESAYKLVISLKNGGLLDFQLIFKRIRYQLLQNFHSLIDQQQQVEMNENPVIEQIMYKKDVAKEFVFESTGLNDSLNELVNQTIPETEENIIS